MTIVYDERFTDSTYADDNAALPGRMEAAMSGLTDGIAEIIPALPASLRQLSLAHGKEYIDGIITDRKRFAMASLAAGGAILAAATAMKRRPAFACIRPPGHHASADGAWGHCTFNNLAIALLDLREKKYIGRAFVLDIDAHTGDGTRTILKNWAGTEVFNPYAESAPEYLHSIEKRLDEIQCTDIIAVSAGFDAYVLDVGRKLETVDFEAIGKLVKKAALRLCEGRRFAVLEGGYYLADLGLNIRSFCRGFSE